MIKKARFPILYLPIEERSREFDSSLLLAAVAAERGFLVVVGQQNFLLNFAPVLPPGVFVFRGLNHIQTRFMKDAGQHFVTVIDEEALGLAEAPLMIGPMHPRSMDHCDLVLAQGNVHSEILRDFGFPSSQVVVTGNPRTDMLREPFSELYEPEAADIRRAYGEFVLITSNAGIANTKFGSFEEFYRLSVAVGWAKAETEDSVALWRGREAHNRWGFEAEIELIERLVDRFPETKIVVRPHPSERRETWESRFADTPSVTVDGSGTAFVWMKAASLVVHASSTTGTEAELLGVPALSMVPPGIETISRLLLSNIANHTVASVDEAFEMIGRHLQGEDVLASTRSNRREVLARHLLMVEGRSSAERIVEVLAERLETPAILGRTVEWPACHVNSDLERPRHNREKFSATPEEARTLLHRIAGVVGRGADLSLVEAWESLFMVSRKGALEFADGVPFRGVKVPSD